MSKPNPIQYIGQIHPREGKESTPLRAAGILTRLQRGGILLLGGVVIGGILWLVGAVLEWVWLEWIAAGFFVLVILMAIYQASLAVVGSCPYCGGMVGDTDEDTIVATDKNQAVECRHCHEWLISDHRQLRPIDDATHIANIEVRAPVFEWGGFPNECLTCGAPAIRHDMIAKTTLQPEWLLLGGIVTNKSYVNGIPYCNTHADQIRFYYLRGKSRFRFEDLAPMRRYLAYNAGKKPVQPEK